MFQINVSHTQTPFVFATEDGLSMLIDECDSVNTKKQISYAENRMKMFRDAGTRKGPGGQTLLKGTDKILIILKSIPWNLEGQLHSSCAKFLPIIFLA